MNSRILFVDHSGSLGGAELYLLDAIRHAPNATTVTFEDGPFPDRVREEGFDVRILRAAQALLGVKKQSSLLDAVRAVPGLVRLVGRLMLLARKHDVLFLNSQKALLVGALAGFLARRPVVWNLHDILTADHFSGLNRWIAVTWANLFVDALVVNSEATLRSFQESGGHVDSTHVVYNGIDATRFDRVAPDQREALRRAFGIGDAPCVGVFSRLAPWKGQHVLLDAIAGIDGLHALVVGDALFAGDEAYAAELKARVRRLGIADRVHFAGFRDDVPALMRTVDVIAHTSTTPEPFGRVIVEGQLARRPVVAAGAGGALEIIDHGVNGLLTPPGDPVALSAALDALVRDPDLARTLGERGRQTAATRYSLERMISGIASAVEAVASPATRRTSPPSTRMNPAADVSKRAETA